MTLRSHPSEKLIYNEILPLSKKYAAISFIYIYIYNNNGGFFYDVTFKTVVLKNSNKQLWRQNWDRGCVQPATKVPAACAKNHECVINDAIYYNNSASFISARLVDV